MDKIKVLVTEYCGLCQEALCRIVDDESDMTVVARPKYEEEAVRQAKELAPDVAIIDVDSPLLNGIEVTKEIRKTCPSTSVLIIAASANDLYVLAALRSGASGYLLKDAHLSELINAIRRVHAGDVMFAPELTMGVLRHIASDKGERRGGLHKLHRRELEVLKLAAKGMHNASIASQLFISERTVQAHMLNIFTRLEVSSRTEAVLRALKEGWLTYDDLP